MRKINLQKSHQLCQNYFTKRNSTSSYVWRQNPLKSQEQRCQPLYSQKLHESQILNKSSSFCWFNTTLLPPGITKLLLMSGAATKISLDISPSEKIYCDPPPYSEYIFIMRRCPVTKDGLSVVITRLIDPKKVYIVCTNTCVIREALKKLVFFGIFP